MSEARDPKEGILALAEGCDATQLSLSAAEGYLLSRIDGATSWRLLREIGGIPPDAVDACLENWVEQGLVVSTDTKRHESSRATTASPMTNSDSGAGRKPVSAVDTVAKDVDAAEVVIDESALNESLDIDLETQRRILEYEASLGRPYHELLGVAPGAEPKLVKRAYFKLSKEFHPDRYFRKEIGCYASRLDQIFKKVLEAHEILSDPELCQVENQLAAGKAAESAQAVGVDGNASEPNVEAESAANASAAPKTLSKLERLRQRMPFKINHAAIAERRARADEIFRSAQVSQQAGRMQEAEQNIRIAISFDPARPEFKEALGSLRIAAAGARASRLLASPSERMSDGELREALTLLEDVLPYRPHDPELNERAARVCMQLHKLDAAEEFVETLLERAPESAPAHVLMGRIYRDRGDLEEAMGAFERALKYDEENLDARRALASVRIGARDAARGGDS